MKKLILLLTALIFISCEDTKITPIEKYKGLVLAYKKPGFYDYGKPLCQYVTLKNKDSIVHSAVLTIDADRYQIGDTIK